MKPHPCCDHSPSHPRRSLAMNRAAPFLLVCAALPVSLAAASATPRLGDAVVPTTESVTLRLDPGKAEYQGSARISLQVRSAAAQVRFHAEGQRLDRVVLSGPSGAIPAKLSRDGALATLSPSRPLAPGAYALAIDFTSPFE